LQVNHTIDKVFVKSGVMTRAQAAKRINRTSWTMFRSTIKINEKDETEKGGKRQVV
jgi:hypothetical protein